LFVGVLEEVFRNLKKKWSKLMEKTSMQKTISIGLRE
jgi:hypothetical protein